MILPRDERASSGTSISASDRRFSERNKFRSKERGAHANVAHLGERAATETGTQRVLRSGDASRGTHDFAPTLGAFTLALPPFTSNTCRTGQRTPTIMGVARIFSRGKHFSKNFKIIFKKSWKKFSINF